MELFLATMNQMAYLGFLMAIGYVLAKTRVVPEGCAAMLSRLENNVFIPAMMMGTFMSRFTQQTIQQLSQYLLVGLVVALISAVVAVLLARCFPTDQYHRNIYTFNLAFSNFGFMGNAVVQVLFPEVFMPYLVFTLPFWAVAYAWGVPSLLIPTKEKKTKLWDWVKSFVNPIFVGVALGAVLGLLAIPLPGFLSDGIQTLGSCMSPVAMLLTGMTICRIDMKKTFRNLTGYIISAIRLVLIPMVAIGLLLVVKLEYSVALCVVCNLAMPLGLSPIMIPTAYGKDTSEAAGMVLISTLMSCITIPVIFGIFSAWIH